MHGCTCMAAQELKDALCFVHGPDRSVGAACPAHQGHKEVLGQHCKAAAVCLYLYAWTGCHGSAVCMAALHTEQGCELCLS